MASATEKHTKIASFGYKIGISLSQHLALRCRDRKGLGTGPAELLLVPLLQSLG